MGEQGVELGEVLEDSVRRLFADHVTPALHTSAEAGRWPAELWDALETHGLTQPLAAEAHGGSGAAWEDAFPILVAAGRAAAPIPLAETIAAGWLVSNLGQEVPGGPMALASGLDAEGLRLSPSGNGWYLSGELPGVGWGRDCGHAVLTVRGESGPCLAFLALEGIDCDPLSNLAGEARDTLRFDGAPVRVARPLPPEADPALQLGALVRSAQMAGAAAWVLDTTLQYASDRVQFGRPLSKLQAIQHYLATLASRVAQATAGTEFAFRAADRAAAAAPSDPLSAPAAAEFEIASAKITVGDAAWSATSVGHQVHGAIGFTEEYALQRATRRLWCWRSEFGAESRWGERIGRAAISRGREALWPDLTARFA